MAFDVGVDKPLMSVLWQQRGYSHQPERRLGRTLAFEGKRVLEAPIRIGKSGIDQ